MAQKRYIVHMDMDAFYASIEQRDDPSLIGKPVIVGADPKKGQGRGVVAACSYEARRFGIHSAMPISQAYRKCPHARFLRGNMKKYAGVSREIFSILYRFTPDIEPVSIDEAFLDITSSYQLFGTPEDVCRKIKSTVKSGSGLTASVGLAPNKMTAKIASDLEKPDGLVIVTQTGLLDFLHPLPVKKLWGVGKRTLETLAGLGIHSIGDLGSMDPEKLKRILGKAGDHLWKLANGIDPRPVRAEETVKSVGNETTFEHDVGDREQVHAALMRLSEKVSGRLRRAGLKGKTITLKIRFSDFKTYTRSHTFEHPTNYIPDIFRIVQQKSEEFQFKTNRVRLVGVQVSNFGDAERQATLFPVEAKPDIEKQEKLHTALDKIKGRFGDHAIQVRPRIRSRNLPKKTKD